jgi:UPF0755 protein
MFLVLFACNFGTAPDPADNADRFFDVPAGATARGLGASLAAEGLVPSASDWTWFLRTGADGSCIKAGRHKVRRSMTASALLTSLCGAPVPKDEPFTVVEGWRIREIDEALAAKGWIQAGEYATAVADVSAYRLPFERKAADPKANNSLEGYLYPETYRVEPEHFKVEAFVQRQLDTFVAKFWDEGKDDLGTRTLDQIVIMASMIEREEPTPSNRATVAGILWKRIDSGWNLGVDATSRYTLADWNDRQAFLKRLRDPDDPYNTRLRPGLPPTAIGNPGIEALKAAAKPVASDWWYYLHDSNKTLHPARTEAEHEANRARYNVY